MSKIKVNEIVNLDGKDYLTLESIARSLNVADSAVIDSTDTVTLLDNVSYIYDATAQTTWGVPTLDSTGKTIVSVVGSALTTTGGTGSNSYTLKILTADNFINTVSDMQNYAPLNIGDVISTSGYASIGDGGANDYEIVAAGTGADDGGSYIDLAGSSLQAKAIFPSGIVVAKQFGVTFDTGVTDDTTAWQSFFDYVKSNSAMAYLGEGTTDVSSTITIDGDGGVYYGAGMKRLIFNWTGTAGDIFELRGNHFTLSDFDCDGNSQDVTFFNSTETGAFSSGVWEFNRVRGLNGTDLFNFGDNAGDVNQADTIMRRVVGNNLTGDFLKVNHDQGVNYYLEMCAVNGCDNILNFIKGGKVTALQTSVRDANTILKVSGSLENTDYYTLNGVSVDGSTQYVQLIDAAAGNIHVTSYSSGNSAIAPTAPLINLVSSRASVVMDNSTILHVFDWDGATGTPLAKLDGISTSETCSLIIKNGQIGSSSDGDVYPAGLVDLVDNNATFSISSVKNKGKFLNAGSDDRILFDATSGISASGDSTTYTDQKIPEYVVDKYCQISDLFGYVTTGTLTGTQKLSVKLQRRRAGTLATLATYKLNAFSGTHDGSGNAAVLSDSTQSFGVNALVGETLTNTTDGSSGIITSNTATTITATLAGGTDNDWDASDAYTISNTGRQNLVDLRKLDPNLNFRSGDTIRIRVDAAGTGSEVHQYMINVGIKYFDK